MSDGVRMMPFFTARDEKILYGESVRDPLGLLPIWSTVGHALVPGLASIVSRIDGIQGVLFIYACLNELPYSSESKLADDKVLQVLERLWEYHLYHYPDKSPCFGITSLSSADFQLSSSRGGVVGTGLRQYYRGSCVNKGIMAGNLRTLNEPYAGIAKSLINPELIKWLKNSAPQMQKGDYSVSASKQYEKLRPSLVRFSEGSRALWEALEKHLLTDVQQQHWIQHLLVQAKWNSLPIPELVVAIQSYAQQQDNQLLYEKCQRILDCEPFVQLLEVVFEMVQEEGRIRIEALSRRLADTAPVHLNQICVDFQRLSFKSKRLEKLKQLAVGLSEARYSHFILEFLQGYYAEVCKQRGKNPIVYVDGPDIIALKPGKTGNDWGKSLDPHQWNGYFIKPQLSLYVDLMHRMRASQ